MSEEEKSCRTNRRTYLAAVGAGITGIAGCAGGSSDKSSTSSTKAGSSGGSNGGSSKTGSSSGKSKDGYTLGFSNFTSSDPFEVVNTQFAKWYGQDMDGVTMKVTAANGSASQQIKDCRNLLNQGVDGLVITAGDSSALAKVVDDAKKKNVPVFGCDIPINSKDVAMHVAIAQEDYGYQAGKHLVKTMNDKYGSNKKKKVLEVMMDQNNSNAVLRHKSFNKAISEDSNANVVKQVEISGYAASSVETKVRNYLQVNTDIHGVFAPWAAGPVGVLRAFETKGMKKKVGEKGHVPIVNCDATASIIDYIKNGYVDMAVDQPLQFYAPIALNYLKKYLDAGQKSSALPSIGDKVSNGDVDIKSHQHANAKLWSHPRWAPANVVSFTDFNGDDLGYPFFRESIPVVNKDNADAAYLWGNVMRQIKS